MEPWQVTLLAAAAGGLIGLIGALGGTLLAQWRQDSRERTADLRRLRDAKLARVRAAFKVVMAAIWGIATATVELRFSYQGETEERRRQRIDRLVTEAMAGINDARAELALEEDTEDVLEEFQTIWASFLAFANAMAADPEQYGGVEARAKERKDNDAKIKSGTESLEKKLRDKLARLEKSV